MSAALRQGLHSKKRFGAENPEWTAPSRMDQPGKVADPARGQLNRGNEYFIALSPFAPGNFVSRDGFGLVRGSV